MNTPPGTPFLVSPANGYQGARLSNELSVVVLDPDGDSLTVTFYGRPRQPKTPAPDFSVVVLPDTQNYTVLPGGGAIFAAQTSWIVEQRLAKSILFVSHVGDVVDSGNYDTDKSEWSIADASMEILEFAPGIQGGIPYGIAPGNHDLVGGASLFEQYFGVARFTSSPPQPRPYYGGHYGADNRNHYEFFGLGEMGFVVLNLDTTIAPSAELLNWAERVLRLNIQRRAILVTHVLLDLGSPTPWLYPGNLVYEALKDNPNLFLMLCGHIGGEGRRQDTVTGITIDSLLADYQYRPNGGDGWLRLLTFSDTLDQIKVETYSPTLGQFETDADSQFSLQYNMRDDFVILGARSNVASGASTSVTWSNLTPGTEYEWFVTVDDGRQITLGATWTFTTQDPSAVNIISFQAQSVGGNGLLDNRLMLFLIVTVVIIGTATLLRRNPR